MTFLSNEPCFDDDGELLSKINEFFLSNDKTETLEFFLSSASNIQPPDLSGTRLNLSKKLSTVSKLINQIVMRKSSEYDDQITKICTLSNEINDCFKWNVQRKRELEDIVNEQISPTFIQKTGLLLKKRNLQELIKKLGMLQKTLLTLIKCRNCMESLQFSHSIRYYEKALKISEKYGFFVDVAFRSRIDRIKHMAQLKIWTVLEFLSIEADRNFYFDRFYDQFYDFVLAFHSLEPYYKAIMATFTVNLSENVKSVKQNLKSNNPNQTMESSIMNALKVFETLENTVNCYKRIVDYHDINQTNAILPEADKVFEHVCAVFEEYFFQIEPTHDNLLFSDELLKRFKNSCQKSLRISFGHYEDNIEKKFIKRLIGLIARMSKKFLEENCEFLKNEPWFMCPFSDECTITNVLKSQKTMNKAAAKSFFQSDQQESDCEHYPSESSDIDQFVICTNTCLNMTRSIGKCLSIIELLNEQPSVTQSDKNFAIRPILNLAANMSSVYLQVVHSIFVIRDCDLNVYTTRLKAHLNKNSRLVTNFNSTIDANDPSTMFALQSRFVATESLIQFLQDLIENVHLFNADPDEFPSNTLTKMLDLAKCVRDPIYYTVALNLIDSESIRDIILNKKNWSLDENRSHSDYIDLIVVSFRKVRKAIDVMEQNMLIPDITQGTLWFHIITLTNQYLLKLYASVQRCSFEIRNIMRSDYEYLTKFIDKLNTRLSEQPMQKNVHQYINAYFLSENDINEFLSMNSDSYDQEYLINLVNCIPHLSRRSKLSIVDRITTKNFF